jgi:hypothetical protein
VPQFEISERFGVGASLECGGLTPLCSATESLLRSGALCALVKRRQAAALQGGVQFQTEALRKLQTRSKIVYDEVIEFFASSSA